jgi:hypothetical protein
MSRGPFSTRIPSLPQNEGGHCREFLAQFWLTQILIAPLSKTWLIFSDDHFSCTIPAPNPVHEDEVSDSQSVGLPRFGVCNNGYSLPLLPVARKTLATMFDTATIDTMDRLAMAQASEGQVPDYELMTLGPTVMVDSTHDSNKAHLR